VSTHERVAWLGRADVDPPGRGGGQGFRRRPLFLFFLYSYAISNTPLLTDVKHSLAVCADILT